MSRSINVSTEVFAAIWANRADGEESEDEILRRLLGAGGQSSPSSRASTSVDGVIDIRNGVHFPEGFEILRSYKRRSYAAHATNGSWVRSDNGQRYASLNRLNASIAAGAENVWNGNWKYRSSDGTLQSINNLRR